jgi:hypothetical protein
MAEHWDEHLVRQTAAHLACRSAVGLVQMRVGQKAHQTVDMREYQRERLRVGPSAVNWGKN